ncbi:putative Zinc finger protein 786 [Hypsibius exemplaris]|uniref:Zinc finger protein 786 n=1 Tax=Hypsibius exemplaris TaxID=2072580 RepID=A0A1W0WME6_HYPEX|nr:putative Zinc finger protein 786 [Hypsibius exemplaris]
MDLAVTPLAMTQFVAPIPKISATWCEICEDPVEGGPCLLHTPLESDQPTIPRAIASLPTSLEMRKIPGSKGKWRPHEWYVQKLVNMQGNERGVFTRLPIPGPRLFGPLVAKLRSMSTDEIAAAHFGVVGANGSLLHYQLLSDHDCNWMKFVRLADDSGNANVAAYQRGEEIYFAAVRPLLEGDELRVGYLAEYASAIGKNDDCVVDHDNMRIFFGRGEDLIATPSVSKIHPSSLPVSRASRRPTKYLSQQTALHGDDEVVISALEAYRGWSPVLALHQPSHSKLQDAESDHSMDPSDDDDPPYIPKQSPHKQTKVKPVAATPRSSSLVVLEQLTLPNSNKRKRKSRKETPVPKPKEVFFTCAHCPAQFRSAELVECHGGRHGKERVGEEFPFQCPGCAFVGVSTSNFLEHIDQHRRPVSTKKTSFTCKRCPKPPTFSSADSLLKHEQRLHPVEAAAEAAAADALKTFTCRTCQRKFLNLAALRIHERRHSVLPLHQCCICLTNCPTPAELREHLESHRVEGLLACRMCDKSFPEYYVLSRHYRSQHHNKTFTCGTCHRVFKRQTHLNRHVATHSAVYPYVCAVCGRRFKWKQQFHKHRQLLHNPEGGGQNGSGRINEVAERVARQFAQALVCQFCTRQYANPERLAIHQRKQHLEMLLQQPAPAGRRS